MHAVWVIYFLNSRILECLFISVVFLTITYTWWNKNFSFLVLKCIYSFKRKTLLGKHVYKFGENNTNHVKYNDILFWCLITCSTFKLTVWNYSWIDSSRKKYCWKMTLPWKQMPNKWDYLKNRDSTDAVIVSYSVRVLK